MSKLIRIKSTNTWEEECLNYIISFIKAFDYDFGYMNIALSGGKTPVNIYAKLGSFITTLPPMLSSRIKIFLVDERDVAITSEMSNSRMILDSIGAQFVVPFDPKIETAQSYCDKIFMSLGDKGKFDLVVLGCGEDGHVASLFPGTPLLEEQTASFLKIKVEKNLIRYSLTFPMIKEADNCLVIVNNNKKKLRYFNQNIVPEEVLPIDRIMSYSNATIILNCDEV